MFVRVKAGKDEQLFRTGIQIVPIYLQHGSSRFPPTFCYFIFNFTEPSRKQPLLGSTLGKPRLIQKELFSFSCFFPLSLSFYPKHVAERCAQMLRDTENTDGALTLSCIHQSELLAARGQLCGRVAVLKLPCSEAHHLQFWGAQPTNQHKYLSTKKKKKT